MEMITGLPAFWVSSISRRIRSEAVELPPVHPPWQHHSLDGVVVARLADEFGHGVAADGARGRVAVLDLAFRHDHTHAAAAHPGAGLHVGEIVA